MVKKTKTETAFEDTLREFSARVRKDVSSDKVRNLQFVKSTEKESFAWGFDSALSLLREIAEEHGIDKSELGLEGMPVSDLVKANLP